MSEGLFFSTKEENYKIMLKAVVCSSVATVPFLLLAHLLFKHFLRRKKRELEVKLEIDVLKINHCLSFGIDWNTDCTNHQGVKCENLNCNIGKLCYLLKFIRECKEHLDVCIYFLSAQIFGDAIVDAHRRGVRVRVIADISCRRFWIDAFLKEGIPVRQKMSSNLMHHKFLIIDKKIVINGSMNLTYSGAFCNWENVLISSQPSLVKQFVNAFQAFWDSFDEVSD